MDSNCSSSARSFSSYDRENRQETQRDYITYYSRHKAKDSSPLPYSTNPSGKQVIIKSGHPMKYWSDDNEPRQNRYNQASKHDEQIPSLAYAPCKDMSEKNFIQRNDCLITQTMESPRIARKQASRCVNRSPSEPRHSLCGEDKLCYPTRTQIGSAFTTARGQCCGPCCLGDVQKYSEPYFLPCYPLVMQEEQVTSPRFDQDICYRNIQLQHSLAKGMTAHSSPKNPIIIDCFSLAISENNEENRATGVNQEASVARYEQYEEEDVRDHEDTNQTKLQHNCMICQQIATGEAVLPQLRSTSGIRNKCCYQETTMANSRSNASATTYTKDESSWDNTVIEREDVGTTSQEQEKKASSPVEVGSNQEHEEHDSQEVMMMRKEVRGIVVKSAFSDPNEKRSKSNEYESNLQVLRRQETRINGGANEQESLPLKNSNELQHCNPPVHYCTSTNTAPLFSPENMTAGSRKDLQRKWEAMYHILEEPDKANKKSYFCSHCGRAFTHLSSLNNHIRTHTGQKPFRCRYCGKRFAQSGVLTAHLRTHTGEKPFTCVLCGKRFAQTTTLANHIRTHTGQKPFSCRYCKRTFAQSSTRNKHELSHTKEKPFECKYCGRSFTQSATVMRHMRIHMRDTKYSCVHCGKTFAYLYSLDKHLDEHT